MDWLNKAWRRSARRFRSLPPNAQLASIALLFGAVVVGTLVLPTGRETEYTALLDGASLSPAEVIQMTAALRKAGLRNSRIEGRQILVPQDKVDDYLVALHNAGALPGDFDNTPVETPGFNPFATREHIQQTQLEADKRKLERILTGMKGVESASVQYTQEKKPGFPPVLETRAVVAVRMAEGRQLRLDEVETIRSTAVAYVAGLDRKDVTITDVNAFHAYPGGDAGLVDNYAITAIGRMWETDLRDKIERQLSMVPGAIIGVTAHFDERVPDSAGDEAAAAATRPVLVTASVGIPDSYCQLIWRQRDSAGNAPSPEQLRAIEEEVAGNIKRAVTAILPTPAIGWETDRQVEVTTYEELAATPQVEPSTPDSPFLGSSTLVGLFFALCTGGAVWWLVAKRNGADASAPSSNTHAAGELLSDLQEGSSPTDAVLQNELQQAIEKDPNAAAKLLNQWLRDAA